MSQTNKNSKALWRPRYGRYDLDLMLKRLDAIASVTHTHGSGVMLAKTEKFIRGAFEQYEGKRDMRRYGFAFAVPTRIQRSSDMYQSEAAHFLPIVNHIDPEMRQQLISGLPPCVIDEYGAIGKHPDGAILFVPLFSDMLHDIKNKLVLLATARKIIRDSALFSRDKLGVQIMGLGATLPKLTKFGAHINRHGIITTTGHGGTVYLMYETLRNIAAAYRVDVISQPVGCIGAGSIGESIARLVLDANKNSRVIIFDIRPVITKKVVDALNKEYGPGRIIAASSNDEVLQKAGVIFSAVTSRIKIGDDVDLSGKIIIDDSQPGSFLEQDVIDHGGGVVWVVGHDNSYSKFLTRQSGYRFGEEGLLNHGDVWGCEAEVGSLWAKNRYDLAIDEAVTTRNAMEIGAIMEECGIRVASYQQHGKPVDLTKVIERK